MSGVDIAGLVERLRAAVDLGDRTGSRGKRPENIYNVADDALTALLAQAAEVEKLTGLLHANGGPRFNEAMRRAESASRQRDEALAALKASEEARDAATKLADRYGVALMMIRAGCSNPQRFAGNILDDVKPIDIDLEDLT